MLKSKMQTWNNNFLRYFANFLEIFEIMSREKYFMSTCDNESPRKVCSTVNDKNKSVEIYFPSDPRKENDAGTSYFVFMGKGIYVINESK